MLGYIAKRLFFLLFTLVGVTVFCFLLLHAIPGDPVALMAGPDATVEDMERWRALLGLDQPLHIQYFIYLQRLIRLDFGTSIFSREPVFPIIERRFFVSLQLAIFGLVISTLIGVTLGVVSGVRRGSKVDNIIKVFSIYFYSMPSFLLGVTLILAFSLYLRLLPSMGGGRIEHLILPALTLGLWGSGFTTRMTRMCVLDVLHQDYVMVARAKGLSSKEILFNYILRNALVAIVTTLGLQFGTMLGGAIVTETVFSYPGLGKLLIDNIVMRDYPVVQGTIVFLAIVFCLINLIVDVAYTYIDPRIRYEKRG